MAGYRNRNFSPNAYRQAGYSHTSNYNQNQGGYQQQQKRVVKHSGCRLKQVEGGAYVVYGWKLSNGDMINMYARPYKGTKISTSKSGKRWANLFVTLTNTKTMVKTNCSGLFNLDTKKLYISDFNLIANPQASNGGYFGKHISKEYNR